MSVNTAYIKDKGGNKKVLFLRSYILALTTTGGAAPTNGTHYLDLGHLASSTSDITPSTTEFKSEDGVIRATDTVYSGKSTAVPMQTSKELIDFLAFTSRENDYIEYAYHGYKNSKQQESFANGTVESGYSLSAPGGASSMKYSFIYTPKSTVTALTTIMLAVMKSAIGLSTFPYVSAATDIPANQEIVFIET